MTRTRACFAGEVGTLREPLPLLGPRSRSLIEREVPGRAYGLGERCRAAFNGSSRVWKGGGSTTEVATARKRYVGTKSGSQPPIRQNPAKSGKIRQNPAKPVQIRLHPAKSPNLARSVKVRQNSAKSGCAHLGCTLQCHQISSDGHRTRLPLAKGRRRTSKKVCAFLEVHVCLV